jgi:outer membrane biosynthesis protein TonB
VGRTPPAPRLFGGAMASVALHGGLIGAFLFLRPAPTPQAPVYRVKLIGGPAGPRAVGVVRPKEQPAAPPVVETPPPPAATPPPETKKTVPVPKAKPTPVPKQVTPTTPPKTAKQATPTNPSKTVAQSKTPPPQQAAGGGPEGGKGADVATIDTPGIEFPYPYYTDNIARQIIQAFGNSNERFTAEIRFVIQRDGTVDPASIQYAKRSGNFSFDIKAKGAVESVANAKRFGPLPAGFREDILPVTFRFSPQLWR